MSVGLLLALGASIFSGSGSVIQARAVPRARELEDIEARASRITPDDQTGIPDDGARTRDNSHGAVVDDQHPAPTLATPGSLGAVGRQPLYWTGLVVDLIGFTCAASALQRLPLFLVQAALASSVGITALITVLMGARLRPRSWVALACAGTGLILLALSADPAPANVTAGPWRWWLVVAGLAAGGLGILGMRMRGPLAGPVIAVGAGLGFGTVSVSARTLRVAEWGPGILLDPGIWAIIVGGVVGAVFFAAALQRSVVTVVAAVTFTVQVVVPSIIGLAFLGDDVRPGFAVAAVIGFLLAAGGAMVLAGRADQPLEGLQEPHFPALAEPLADGRRSKSATRAR